MPAVKAEPIGCPLCTSKKALPVDTKMMSRTEESSNGRPRLWVQPFMKLSCKDCSYDYWVEGKPKKMTMTLIVDEEFNAIREQFFWGWQQRCEGNRLPEGTNDFAAAGWGAADKKAGDRYWTRPKGKQRSLKRFLETPEGQTAYENWLHLSESSTEDSEASSKDLDTEPTSEKEATTGMDNWWPDSDES